MKKDRKPPSSSLVRVLRFLPYNLTSSYILAVFMIFMALGSWNLSAHIKSSFKRNGVVSKHSPNLCEML